jgi:hypothetical protein
MDVQFAAVMIILIATVGGIGMSLWKRTRQRGDSCSTNCGCGSGSKKLQTK